MSEAAYNVVADKSLECIVDTIENVDMKKVDVDVSYSVSNWRFPRNAIESIFHLARSIETRCELQSLDLKQANA